MGLKWGVTGGLGFIGKNLVKLLSMDSSNEIRIFDNYNSFKAEFC